jgi:hypothetical protein
MRVITNTASTLLDFLHAYAGADRTTLAEETITAASRNKKKLKTNSIHSTDREIRSNRACA